jgi:MinD-like ATPase involved in chromosome partitioning or flagellar assembly
VSHQTLALVGAVGGAGTTRTAVECGGLLATAGYDVAVLDAAFATQGLADYVSGRLPTDLTAVVTEDVPLEDALVPIATDLAGDLVAAPARAPFERVARAKTAGAADRFERAVAAAGFSSDVVIVDTPPVAANQAVAAVSACERVALVAPATRRGADGVARMSGVLEDVGAPAAAVVTTQAGDEDVLPEAVARLPAVDVRDAADCPSCVRDGSPLARPVAALVAATLDVEIEVETPESGGIERFLPGGE